jgi:two-component system chemotaxis response regulator CheY
MSAKRVLSIGQCGADHYGISQAIRAHFDAEIIPAATAEQALALLREASFDLVLVNRILDANGAPGLKIIAQLKNALPESPPIMLVSNYPEYQQQAEELGAVPGFGKGNMDETESVERLRNYLSPPREQGNS